MRRGVLSAALLLTVLPAAPSDARAARDRPRGCAAQPGVTVEANRVARVYRRRRWLYACVHRRSGRFTIGELPKEWCGSSSSGCPDSVGDLTMAGHYVAYESVFSGRTDRTSTLYLADVLRRRERVVWTEGGPSSPTPSADVADVVVTRRGSVAWIARLSGNPLDPARYEVRKHDREGAGLLDAGEDVDGGSLAIAGTRIYWMRGGSTFSATLVD